MALTAFQQFAATALIGVYKQIAPKLSERDRANVEDVVELAMKAFGDNEPHPPAIPRFVRVGDYLPEPVNENISEDKFDRSQEALAYILGVER